MRAVSRERQPRGVVRNFHLPLLRDRVKLILAQQREVGPAEAGGQPLCCPSSSISGQGRFPLTSPRGRPPAADDTPSAARVKAANSQNGRGEARTPDILGVRQSLHARRQPT